MPISCFLTKEEEEEEKKIHIVQSKTRAVYTTSHPVNGNHPPPHVLASLLTLLSQLASTCNNNTHTQTKCILSLVHSWRSWGLLSQYKKTTQSIIPTFFPSSFFPLTTTAKLSIFFLRGEKKKKKTRWRIRDHHEDFDFWPPIYKVANCTSIKETLFIDDSGRHFSRVCSTQ